MLFKVPDVRRKCMMLCKSFYDLCTHEDHARLTRALTVSARSFRPKLDRVDVLIRYIQKHGPNCVDLKFKDCFLPGM
jgi:hypothetical protein